MKYVVNKQLPPQVGVALFLLLLFVAYYRMWHIPNENCLGSGWENVKIGLTLDAQKESSVLQTTSNRKVQKSIYAIYPLKFTHLKMLGYVARKDTLTNLEVCEILNEFHELDKVTPWTNYVKYVARNGYYASINRLSLEHAISYPYAVIYERKRVDKGEKWIDLIFIGREED